jgi:hypothetical protein
MSKTHFSPLFSGSSRIKHYVSHGVITGLALALSAGLAWAGSGGGSGSGAAPEIDPTVAISGLTVLAGALLLIADRVRKSRFGRR